MSSAALCSLFRRGEARVKDGYKSALYSSAIFYDDLFGNCGGMEGSGETHEPSGRKQLTNKSGLAGTSAHAKRSDSNLLLGTAELVDERREETSSSGSERVSAKGGGSI